MNDAGTKLSGTGGVPVTTTLKADAKRTPNGRRRGVSRDCSRHRRLSALQLAAPQRRLVRRRPTSTWSGITVHKETAAMTDTLGQVLDRPLPETPVKLAESMRPAMSHIVETAYEKKFLSEPPSTNGMAVEQAVTAETGETAPPSTDGFSPAPRAPLPKGSFTDVPPGMAEFYDTLVQRGFAPPIPDDQKRS